MLKNGKINPLNALGVREVKFPAIHFHYTQFNKFNQLTLQRLDNWIRAHLKGRYYIGKGIALIDNTIVCTTRIGFEDEKELTFFNLAAPKV
jgi:hypothetical protein